MSIFWLVYWITLGTIVLLTAIIGIFFRIDDEDVSISYIVLTDFLGAIPCANILVGLVLVIMVLLGIFEEDLTPKY